MVQIFFAFFVLSLLCKLSKTSNQLDQSFHQSKTPSFTNEIQHAFDEKNVLMSKYEIHDIHGNFMYSFETMRNSLMQLDNIETELGLNEKVLSEPSNPNFSTIGLLNALSNCYMNASLQVLFHMEIVRKKTIALLAEGIHPIPLIQFYRALTAGRPENPFRYLRVSLLLS